jgi:GTPase SAR1 family protein
MDAALIVFDVSKEKMEIENYVKEVKVLDIPFFIVGNKLDLKETLQFESIFYKTSAKENKGFEFEAHLRCE